MNFNHLFLKMCLLFVCVGAGSLLSAQITLRENNISIEDIINKIEDSSEYRFLYSKKMVDVTQKVSVSVQNEDVKSVLDKLFARTDIDYSMNDRQIILNRKGVFAEAPQKKTVTGTIIDPTGEPIIGASVLEQGTSNGVLTDVDGHFTLTVNTGAVLRINYLGYITQEVAVGNLSNLQITLSEDVQALGEVVVTALGLKREEKALGYAVQNLKGDNLQTVKGINVATSLTGKIAGVNVLNSTEFGQAPTIQLRGENPLIVIDGVPYANMTLGDIAADDIESMSVLKGATASALYGARGQNGSIMVTTKKGADKDGFSVTVNSGTMFTAGYLAIPELQSQYGRVVQTNADGTLQYVGTGDGSWGPPMEGQEVIQWDPVTKSMRPMPFIARGKDNFKNFLEQGYILNNNVSLAQKGEYGNIRASVNWVNNKGNYPNSTFNKYAFSLGGDILIDKITVTAGLSYNKQISPNLGFNGYTGYDPMYTMLIWASPDWDVRDYKDYWIIPNETQNSSYTAGNNNPYFDRYERLHSLDKDIFNGSFEVKYEPSKFINSLARIGYDTYSNRQDVRISKGSFQGGGNSTILQPNGTEVWGESMKGSYNIGLGRGYSINGDFITSANYTFGDFTADGMIGGSMMYQQDEGMQAFTAGGLSVPGFYSLNASINPKTVTSRIYKRQTNSLYGRAGLSWRSLVFAEVTLRNDWVSTLPETTRSYLYPSVSGSFLVSELLPKTDWLSLWKLRASWVTSKKPADIYAINSVFAVSNNVWGTLSSAALPTTIRGTDIFPESTSTFEIGTAINLLKNRLSFDVAHYQRKAFDFIKNASISPASGYLTNFVNTDEEITRKGWEVTVNATPVENKDFSWDVSLNWTKYADYYTKLDSVYTTNYGWSWVKVGERADPYIYRDYLRDPEGNIIHNASGNPTLFGYNAKFGNQGPDWIWGLSTSLRYKDWLLGLSFDGRVGGLITTVTEMYMWQAGSHPESLTPERYLDATQPGTKNYIGKGVKIVSGTVEYDTYGNILNDTRVFAPNDIPTTYSAYAKALHPGTAWGGNVAEPEILSGTFLKLRELSLTYNVPKAICSKFRAEQLSISAVGQNVLFWAKDFKYSDPDGGTENFADPSQRFLGFNIKLGF